MFDSGVIEGTALEWPLVDDRGQPVDTGRYEYRLTIRAGRGTEAQIQRGHLQIERARSTYRIDALSSETSPGVALTVVDATTSAASAGDPAATFRRSFSGVTFGTAATVTGGGETNHMTKWIDGPAGVLGDANVTELNGTVVSGNGLFSGNLHLYGAATHDVFAGMGPNR